MTISVLARIRASLARSNRHQIAPFPLIGDIDKRPKRL
jgi:hypothetical protein